MLINTRRLRSALSSYRLYTSLIFLKNIELNARTILALRASIHHLSSRLYAKSIKSLLATLVRVPAAGATTAATPLLLLLLLLLLLALLLTTLSCLATTTTTC